MKRVIVGLLAGTLNRAAMGKDVLDFNADFQGASNTGQAIVAIDVAAFGEPGEFKRRVDKVVREMRNSERMPGVEPIWVPGEQANTKRVAYAREGIPRAPQLVEALDQVATELGIAQLAK